MTRRGHRMTDAEREQNRERAHAWYHQPGNAERQRARIQEKRQDPEQLERMRAAARVYSRNWREKNRAGARDSTRRWRYRNKYGMTDSEVETLLAHNGICDSCGAAPARDIDHDHTAGRYAGYLCHPCNVAAGMLMDDPVRARHLADYLGRTRPPAG